MIDLPLLLAFLAAASVLTITPGVDTAMVLRAAAVEGRRSAALAAFGVALGCLCWGAIAALGLGALLRASEVGYAVVKFAGAAYLVALGVRLLAKPRTALTEAGRPKGRPGGAFWRGVFTNLLNPKVGLFYVTFLPQFVPPHRGVAGYSFGLACLHVALTLAWFAVLIAATAPVGKFLLRPKAVKILDRLTGGIFVAFGIRLATSTVR
ncbi:LysE family translocator [Acidocella sp.]|uniref:LysE family translocator n=1 Tax=Acidocella sp. TaxID=50710 RepID=UPI0026351219|nr:LysE family translocator [Acidocella sp.]